MYKISDEQVEFILEDIKANGVVIEDLQYNLLDHICCIIEYEMDDNGNFYEFYKQLLPRFFKRDLREIQEETEVLLTFKNYYAMKNTLKISGIASALLTLMGSILKFLHLPGAGICIVLGGALFCLVFLPLLIALKFRDEESTTDKWVFSLGFLLAMGACAGILFKIMHWPFANILMFGSITGILFIYVPLYFLTRFRRPEAKFNTIVNSVLMTACSGLLFSLFNLGYSTKLQDSLASSANYVEHNKKEILQANAKMLALANMSDSLMQFHKQSLNVLERIDAIRANLIHQSEGISLAAASRISIADLQHPNDTDMLRHHFENASGTMSLGALENEIKSYNALMGQYFPQSPEKLIALDELQLRNSVMGVVLQNLTQIQLQVASNENAYLNFLSH